MQRPDFDAPSSEWLVYADALQVAGDKRGELITLVHSGNADARDEYVLEHAEALLGGASHAYFNNAFRFTWRHCFVDVAEVRVTSNDAPAPWIGALLGAPVAECLRELVIVGVTDNGKEVDLEKPIYAACNTAWPARMTSLAIVDERATRSLSQISREFGVDENLVKLGDLSAVWKHPQLTRLRFEIADAQSIDFGDVDGSNLESFTLRTLRYGDGWGEANPLSAKLGATSWPKLQELELRLAETFAANIPYERKPYVAVYSDDERYDEADDGDNDGVNYSELEPFFKKLVKSPLRRMALTSFDSCNSLLETLRRTGLPPTLKILDLSDSALDRDNVMWMRENAKLFAPLEQLVVERTNIIDSALGDLQGLGPAIVHSHAETTPTYRYVVGSE